MYRSKGLFIVALRCLVLPIINYFLPQLKASKLKWIELYCNTTVQWHHSHCEYSAVKQRNAMLVWTGLSSEG